MDYIDPVMASGKHYRELLANEQVRALEMRVAPGESDNTHSHHDETVYFVTGGRVRVHLPDGGSQELEIPDGFVMWHEAWTHRVENIGSSEIHAIIIEAQP